MSLLKKNHVPDVVTPVNDSSPLRVAFLGGPRSGKSSIISKLTMGQYHDTYYPTHQTHPILFTFHPSGELSRSLLDESDATHALRLVTMQRNLLLSPVIYQAYSRLIKGPKTVPEGSSELVVTSSNAFYRCYHHRNELGAGYVPPHISPIFVELIDTPAFNPDQVVPFLEASLYIKLDKEILRNLANEPRRPVSTNPLLVASGASALNGAVDGYFFVYSAIPSYNPPAYGEIFDSVPTADEDTTFDLLNTIKVALDEAWKEYNSFKNRWREGKESDIFLFKSALKNIWQERNLLDIEASRMQMRNEPARLQLLENAVDPADPSCPPPIWVICTHTKSPLASPKLIEDGLKLSKFWRCGYVGIDADDSDIDECLSLMVREILERKNLQAKFKRKR